MSARLHGVFGRPFLDLSAVIDTSGFAALDREITRGLAGLEVGGTGATLKSMGVVAPWAMDDGRRDALEAIRAMDDGEYQDFLALGDDPPDEPPGREGLAFGDESPRPFTLAQQRLLELRHGVYFPWRWCHHFIADGGWDDKHSGEGKGFSDETRARFPQTCAFIRSLPFTEVGRAVLFGLGPHDHAPLHRDTEPGEALAVAQSILFAPRPGKRFYLQNAPDAAPLVVARPVYWFNDMDYHGVLADPFFRYSIRVDGVFDRGFLRDLAHRARSA